MDTWLINGPTALIRRRGRAGKRRIKEAIKMARRKKRSSRRYAANPAPKRRRSRKSHRKSSRRARRSYHHNPGPGMWKDLMMAVFIGGGAYLLARKADDAAAQHLPSMIPMQDIVAPALVAAAAIWASDKFLRDPRARFAAQAAASIPLVEALVNKAGYGSTFGVQRMLMLPAPAGGSAPLSANLAASLRANLEDTYSSDY